MTINLMENILGWGYNDAFDKPDEEEEPEILDEDELYARVPTRMINKECKNPY